MMLLIDGREIGSISLGLVFIKDDEVVFVNEPQIFNVRAEGFFGQILDFLKEKNLGFKDLDGLIIKKGGGSATALRATYSLVNAWAFALQKKIYEVDSLTGAVSLVETKVVLPEYDHAPNIVPSNKDALKRLL